MPVLCRPASDLTEAGAPAEPEIEVTPDMIEAAMMAYYINYGSGWANPGYEELSLVLCEVYRAMAKSAPTASPFPSCQTDIV